MAIKMETAGSEDRNQFINKWMAHVEVALKEAMSKNEPLSEDQKAMFEIGYRHGWVDLAEFIRKNCSLILKRPN